MTRFIILYALLLGRFVVNSWVSPQPQSISRISTTIVDRNTRNLKAQRSPLTEQDTDERNEFFFPWSQTSSRMSNQVDYLESTEDLSEVDKESEKMSPVLIGAGAVAASVAVAGTWSVTNNMEITPSDIINGEKMAIDNPSATLENVADTVESMGTFGFLYFGVAYTIAEILAIPAIPLTASAGYLFGPVEGTAVVLVSASIAAAASFVIGRTLLRDYVERVLEDYPKFAKIDRAIGKEGFKLMLLLRLSPIFPFALSNYLYGASSINFSAFFFGTLFGFAPGTLAYVYTGYVGKALTDGGDSAYPWYVYAGGLAIFAGLLKVVADTATRVVEELEDDTE